MVEANGPEGQRCKGKPVRVGGKRWGNLGRSLSSEACRAACLQEDLCAFAVFRTSKGVCSAFASCATFQGKGFMVWEKVAA